MHNIRGRLLISYIALVVLTIVAVGIAFILLLNSRNAPPGPTYQRLVDIALRTDPIALLLRSIAPQNRLNQPGRPLGDRLDAVGEELAQLALQEDVRVMLISLPARTVLFDSAGTLVAGAAFSGTQQEYNLGERGPAGVMRPPGLRGSFQDGGAEWLFVGVNTTQFRGESFYILFADHRAAQSLGGVFAEFVNEVLRVLVQAALVSLTLAVVLAFVISRGVARPLQHMAEAAAQIAGGRFNQRVPVQGVAEVRAVGEALNRIVTQVQDEQRSQQDFLANVSHDLKTPLTSIQGYSQAIIDGAAPDPVHAAQIIYDEAARLNRMVGELTDLARLQAGRLSMQMSAIDLGQLTGAIAQRLQIVALEKHIALESDTPPMPSVAADGDRMAQVLTNLISNAINYTPAGGSVRVRATAQAGGVAVEVSDSGIGIAADELPRIFERFYQVDKARGPRRGTGLGLAIVQEIVQAHGGTITAASAGRDQGSTFTVWLPSPSLPTVARRRM